MQVSSLRIDTPPTTRLNLAEEGISNWFAALETQLLQHLNPIHADYANKATAEKLDLPGFRVGLSKWANHRTHTLRGIRLQIDPPYGGVRYYKLQVGELFSPPTLKKITEAFRTEVDYVWKHRAQEKVVFQERSEANLRVSRSLRKRISALTGENDNGDNMEFRLKKGMIYCYANHRLLYPEMPVERFRLYIELLERQLKERKQFLKH